MQANPDIFAAHLVGSDWEIITPSNNPYRPACIVVVGVASHDGAFNTLCRGEFPVPAGSQIFFDLAGWRWEYETPDEVGWTPDFLLIGAKQTVKVLNSAADDSRSTTSGSCGSALTISTSRPIAKRATA